MKNKKWKKVIEELKEAVVEDGGMDDPADIAYILDYLAIIGVPGASELYFEVLLRSQEIKANPVVFGCDTELQIACTPMGIRIGRPAAISGERWKFLSEELAVRFQREMEFFRDEISKEVA